MPKTVCPSVRRGCPQSERRLGLHLDVARPDPSKRNSAACFSRRGSGWCSALFWIPRSPRRRALALGFPRAGGSLLKLFLFQVNLDVCVLVPVDALKDDDSDEECGCDDSDWAWPARAVAKQTGDTEDPSCGYEHQQSGRGTRLKTPNLRADGHAHWLAGVATPNNEVAYDDGGDAEGNCDYIRDGAARDVIQTASAAPTAPMRGPRVDRA